jgi:hypothetical protein
MSRVKEQAGADLIQPFPTKEPTEEELAAITDIKELPLLMQLQVDAALFSEVLYWVLQPKCEEAGVSRDSFLDAIDGATLGKAKEVFWPIYSDFFQQAGQEPLAQMIGVVGNSLKTMMDEIHVDSEALEENMKVAVRKANDGLSKMAGPPSGSSPESLASTPAHSP